VGPGGDAGWTLQGGPRDVEGDWETGGRACEDAGHIVSVARHLFPRVCFLLPVLPGDRNGMERLETAMEVYDRFQPLNHAHPHVRLAAAEARAVEPGLSPAVVGALSMEEWGVDPHRLAFANVLDALEAGAQALNHSRVTGFLRDGPAVKGVRYRAADGTQVDVEARVVVNAAGPWVPEVCGLAGVEVRLRPAKGIHIVYDRRISNFGISAEAADGRDLIAVPHGPLTLLGTTDDDYYGDLDAADVLRTRSTTCFRPLNASFRRSAATGRCARPSGSGRRSSPGGGTRTTSPAVSRSSTMRLAMG